MMYMKINALIRFLYYTVLRARSSIFNRFCRTTLFHQNSFDSDFYLQSNEDLNGVANLFDHYIAHGRMEGREARFFDSEWYLNKYPDVKSAGMDALYHFTKYGKKEGRRASYTYVKLKTADGSNGNYTYWLAKYQNSIELDVARSLEEKYASDIKISIVMPTYNPSLDNLRTAIESVMRQKYGNWQLCICDDASTHNDVKDLINFYTKKDSRVKAVFNNSNSHISISTNNAISISDGLFVGFMDHDDVLHEDALLEIARVIGENPNVNLIYTDEDKISDSGIRFDPYFKPDFNHELLLGQNFISHFSVLRRSVLESIGGLRAGFEGAQDHDLVLRVVEVIPANTIVHIPRVLYHWRVLKGSTALDVGEKPYALAAGIRAVEGHIKRMGRGGSVTQVRENVGYYSVKYDISISPKISIIIPTKDRLDLLSKCIDSIFKFANNIEYEIIIVDNGSTDAGVIEYQDGLDNKRVKIIRKKMDFNFSAMINLGRVGASGDFLCILNNDIEITSIDWLVNLLRYAQFDDVGCVGCKLIYPSERLQHCGILTGFGGVAVNQFVNEELNFPGYFGRALLAHQVSAVTAACLVVRSDYFDQVGGFDETLAVAFNDVDFCLKIQALGKRNIYTPLTTLVHHESASRGPEDTAEKRVRFETEVNMMKDRWGEELRSDPSYNPNLDLEEYQFGLSFPPRVSYV